MGDLTTIIDRLKVVETLIARNDDFLVAAETPDCGYRPPSADHPTGRWAFPVAIDEAADWDDTLSTELRRHIVRALPGHLRWIRITPNWCPPLWYIGHSTALHTVRRAINAALQGEPGSLTGGGR